MTTAEWIRELSEEMGPDSFCEALALQMERPRPGEVEAMERKRISRSTPKITGTIKIVKR